MTPESLMAQVEAYRTSGGREEHHARKERLQLVFTELCAASGHGESPSPEHRINAASTVAVATDYYWEPMETCPTGVKVQLLNEGGVAIYGTYDGKTYYGGWAPVPKRRD